MTNKLNNEEINRVFSMYLPCTALDVIASKCLKAEYAYVNLTAIAFDEGMLQWQMKDSQDSDWGNTEYFKLLLKPLSAISDEDALEIYSMGYTECTGKNMEILPIEKWGKMTFMQGLYLIEQGYAIPLYFSPNHWANGKTALELNIAIEQK